jgi:uncharacterized protein (TIGR02646 family)
VLAPGLGSSSIEHIIPKTANPEVTFQYTNLVLCCLDPQTCNLHKKGQHFSGFDTTGRWAEGFVDRAVAAMNDQLEAVALFLEGELELGGLKPFFSAKRQLFPIQTV